ncbi:MAG: putative oxidoreductase [Caulobacteraceae bacterium]|nr:putative oxidoreductase [Caulobacteraceae bacterium]
MQDLRDKVAVVTGGTSGIGFAVAQALGREGARLMLADIDATQLDEAVRRLQAAGIETEGLATDVSKRDEVERLADRAWERFGAVHIVMNNAGVAVFGATQDMTHEDWMWSVNVNLWGPIHGVESFVPRMIAHGAAGHVLFTSSFAGLVSNRDLGAYNVTKAAVVALAESLRKDVAKAGIGVSVLCPMRVATNIANCHLHRPQDLGGAGTSTHGGARRHRRPGIIGGGGRGPRRRRHPPEPTLYPHAQGSGEVCADAGGSHRGGFRHCPLTLRLRLESGARTNLRH